MFFPELFPMTQAFLLFGAAVTALAALAVVLEGGRFVWSRLRARHARTGRVLAKRRAARPASAGRGG